MNIIEQSSITKEYRRDLRKLIPEEYITEETKLMWKYDDQRKEMMKRIAQRKEQQQQEKEIEEKTLIAVNKALNDIFKDWK